MQPNLTKSRNRLIADTFNRIAVARDEWIEKNRYFYEQDWKYMRFLIPEGSSVLEIGCGTGRLLSELRPTRGVGIDLSSRMINIAKSNYPQLEFHHADVELMESLEKLEGTFDYIVISDTIGLFSDCLKVLNNLQLKMDGKSRLIVAYYGKIWDPILKISEILGLKMKDPDQNWLAPDDINGLLHLSDLEAVSFEWRILVPKNLLGLGNIVNRYVATLPLLRKLGLRNYTVARSVKQLEHENFSASVIIPCRNERGNIESAVQRLPHFAKNIEIIFVEGHSKDGTFEECERVKECYPDRNIKVIQQSGRGKGDAVRTAFNLASGDVFIILDADLTVPPEDIGLFFDALRNRKGEFINGTRLVYPMESQAMRFLNLLANWIFARLFSYILNQRFTDTLCGTKALTKIDYEKIAENRTFFGYFDPFGDFDLIFGASKLNLKIVEIPIRYRNRTYGKTQISRFRHGWLLIKMVVFAFRKLKAF